MGQHADAAQRILGELGSAKACLLEWETKAAYDASLRESDHGAITSAGPGEPLVSIRPSTSPTEPIPPPAITEPQLPAPQFAWSYDSPSRHSSQTIGLSSARRPKPTASWAKRELQKIDGFLKSFAGEGSTLLHGFLRVSVLAAVMLVSAACVVAVVSWARGLTAAANAPPVASRQSTSQAVIPSETDSEPNIEVAPTSTNPNRTEMLVPEPAPSVPAESGSPPIDEPKTAAPKTDVHLPSNAPEHSAAPSSDAESLPSEITNSIGMQLKLIPAGQFMMGSPASEADRQDDEHLHPVQITKPFYLGKTEVTQGQWESVMGTKPWLGQQYVQEGADFPATFVSWDDAVEFCRRLSEKEIRAYRLPTEAEWEYSCRARSRTIYSFGDSTASLKDHAWFNANASPSDEKYAHRVGQKRPNAFGLFDMHGNIWEWCSDWYRINSYATSVPNDPTGPVSGTYRVFRGGGWDGSTFHSRAADRSTDLPSLKKNNLGFRVVCGNVAAAREPVPTIEPKPAASVDEVINSVGLRLRLIPSGEFTMGSSQSEPDREDDEQQHVVRITQPFYMATTEVTQSQWQAVMNSSPWKGQAFVKIGRDYPATYVNWYDAVDFCRRLTTKENLAYRLPTEAEWEYACRGQTVTTYSFGNSSESLDEFAWYVENARNANEKHPHRVGQKMANSFGLFDVHGNVLEWCSDWYTETSYNASAQVDPQGPKTGNERVLRGGSWNYSAWNARCANRHYYVPEKRYNDFGFRVVRARVGG